MTEHTSGEGYALRVLVSMASDDELESLEATLEEYGRPDARDAVRQARERVAVDIAMCVEAGF